MMEDMALSVALLAELQSTVPEAVIDQTVRAVLGHASAKAAALAKAELSARTFSFGAAAIIGVPFPPRPVGLRLGQVSRGMLRRA
jgi:hypothetical protein